MTRLSTSAATAVADRPGMTPCFDIAYDWRRSESGTVTLWFRGHLVGSSPEGLAARFAVAGAEGSAAVLAALDGSFSLIVIGLDWAVAAVDRVRAYPLVWACDGDSVLVDHEGARLVDRLGLGPEDVDPDMATAFALSGFTIGDATLYRSVRQVGAGEYLLVRRGEAPVVGRYHRWTPWLPESAEPGELVASLSRLHERLIEKLVASASGRPIVVPLSAGLDSRFVASGLSEAGYRNVRCFAYGQPGNREAVASREIARRLGYDWSFVPYGNARVRAEMAKPEHDAYETYADSLTAIPFPQDYVALRAMMREHGIAPDAIVVNGQSGDFITGNHIPAALHEVSRNLAPDARQGRIVAALIAKHFGRWRALRTPDRIATVRALLCRAIDAAGGLPEDPAGDHGVYEACEFVDRQSKYVVNGQRLYEWFGLDWRLPLWDRDYLDFWEKAPLAAKRHQGLYRRVLERDNWGKVWRDIPVNPARVRPGWMAPLRLALRAAHAPLGAARWHRFEKRHLEYWMSPLCSYAPWSYSRISADLRGHTSAVAWHIERYLSEKGLDWTGARRRQSGDG